MSSKAFRITSTRHLEPSIHILVWAMIIAERWINHSLLSDQPAVYGFYQTFVLLICFILPIYVNALILIPRYFNKSQWVRYVLLLIPMLLLTNVLRGMATVLYFQFSGFEYTVHTEFVKWAFSHYYGSFDKFLFGPTALILLLSFAYRFVKDWLVHERVKSALVSEKVAMELAFLKSQVDPHFLFNTLNNLYALALEEKAERTADGVAKMGTLMRYSLHDAQADKIPLQKEIAYLEKYIELQKVRIAEGAKTTIKVAIEMGNVTNETIAPMMLVPFIENAFKWGISMVAPSRIDINLRLANGILSLGVRNTIHEIKMTEPGGIGLKNVQNRLRLLYPRRHRLACTNSNQEYTVHLELDLRDD